MSGYGCGRDRIEMRKRKRARKPGREKRREATVADVETCQTILVWNQTWMQQAGAEINIEMNLKRNQPM